MIDCALIGCGYWGSKLKRYLEENNHFNLKYVCNSKTDLTAVWNDEQITAVVVATPNSSHYNIVKSALLSGKDVLSEKPLALTTVECEELGTIAAEHNRGLLIQYTYTFSRALKQAQTMIRDGHIGSILGIEMTVRHLGRFKGGSVYWLLGSHMLSVLDIFLPIRDTSFWRTDLATLDGQVETGAISFRNGEITGQIVVSLNYPGKETKILIYGSEGTIVYDPLSHPSLIVETYERIPWTVMEKLPRNRQEFDIDESNNLLYAIQEFEKMITSRDGGNGDRAIAVTEILEELEIHTAVERGHKVL